MISYDYIDRNHINISQRITDTDLFVNPKNLMLPSSAPCLVARARGMSKVVRPRSRAQGPDLHRANDGAAGPPMQDLAVFDSPPTGAVENSMSIHMLQNNDSDSCCLMVSCCRLHFGMLSLCSSLWWVVFLGHSPRFFETTRNCCTNFETASR